MKLPKKFNSMTPTEQKEYVAKKLLEARQAEKFWADVSRRLVYGKAVLLEDFERPDLEIMK